MNLGEADTPRLQVRQPPTKTAKTAILTAVIPNRLIRDKAYFTQRKRLHY